MAFFLDLSGIMVIVGLALLSLTAGSPLDGSISLLTSAVVSESQSQLQQKEDPSAPGIDARLQDQQPRQPAPAGSDAPAEEKKPPTPPHTGLRALVSGLVEDVRHVPSPQNGYLALVGGGLALAAHQADTSFNHHLSSNYTFVNTAFAPAKYVGGSPVQAGIALGTYAYGRAFDAPKVSHLGMDLLRAQLLTEGMVQTLKLATRRERPDASNHQSFPSGHAAITFAGATVLERHLGWKHSAVAYAVATYVAASRLHDNVHYLSDVAFGAAVGAIGGRTVTQHGRQVWTFVPVSVPGGMTIVAMRTP